MATKRWTITDHTQRAHTLTFRHGVLGLTLHVDREVVVRKYRLDPSGTYQFTVSGRSAVLDVTKGPDGAQYTLTVDGHRVGESGLTLASMPEDTSPAGITQAVTARLRLEQRRNGAAAWFYWIAGLSAINSLLYAGGGDISFPIGLGITQLIDGIALGLSGAQQTPPLAIIAGLIIATGFFLIGRKARSGNDRAYVAGMSLYALDTLIFALVQDWLSIAFHAFALLGLFTGLRAGQALRAQGGPSGDQPSR